MGSTQQRRSPVHELLSAWQPKWAILADAPIALRFTSADIEAQAIKTLGLCDVSALPKLGVKGFSAGAWLSEHYVDVPPATFETRPLADGGVVARLGADEFLLESGVEPMIVPDLHASIGLAAEGTYRVERQDGTFLLVGEKAVDVMSQICGIDIERAAPHHLIMTRMAGVTCGILPEPKHDTLAYRLWHDPTDSIYLWEQLVQITGELGGTIVGAACFYPQLLS